jgi:outer membrane protein TolC
MSNGVLRLALVFELIALVFPLKNASAQPSAAAGTRQAQIPPVPGPAQPAPSIAQPEPPRMPEMPANPAVTGSHGVPLSLTHAVQTALRRHPALVNARAELALARGTLRAAQGPFDLTVTTGLSHNHITQRDFTPSSRVTSGTGITVLGDRTDLTLGASTNLRWGTGIRAAVGLSRDDVRQRPGPRDLEPNQIAVTELAITQPLLRGAGSYGAASAVISGEHAERAAQFQVDHAAQLQAYTVISAYWDLVGAVQERALFESSLSRAQRMLDETRELVAADRRPRGGLRAL